LYTSYNWIFPNKFDQCQSGNAVHCNDNNNNNNSSREIISYSFQYFSDLRTQEKKKFNKTIKIEGVLNIIIITMIQSHWGTTEEKFWFFCPTVTAECTLTFQTFISFKFVLVHVAISGVNTCWWHFSDAISLNILNIGGQTEEEVVWKRLFNGPWRKFNV